MKVLKYTSITIIIAVIGYIFIDAILNYTSEGIIVNKIYRKAYTSTETDYLIMGKAVVPQTHSVYHSAKYILCVEKQTNNRLKTGQINVTPKIYKSYQIGDYYPKKTK